MIKERIIKLKSQPRWVVRIFMLLGVVLGGVFAFVSHPIGGTNAQSVDCPEGKYLATGNVCITNDKDIVIQATATEANQTLKINKYFANAYTVDWGDGVTGDLIADTTHTYDTAGTYEITLSLSGADRWTFTGVTKPLVPKNGTTVTGVEIIYMPSLTDGFGDSATELGDYFFTYFNYNGKLTSLPANSFDTSNISGSVGNNFFSYFNQGGALTILPVGAFGLSNITTVGDSFFIYFNYNGSLTSLPVNSFDISNITTVGDSFFAYFNSNGKLTNLPANSFNTSNLMIVGDNFFSYFNQRGSLINLPEGSFSIPNIIAAGNNFFYSFNNSGQLTSLPVGSFDISSITTVGDSFFRSFNYNGKLTSLPANSFNTSNISGLVGNYFFDSFNYNGSLTELPIGSFDISSITKVSTINLLLLVGGTNFFSSFNKNGALTSLPVGSFNTSNISGSAGNYFFSSFNENGALTSLPVNSFDISSITTIGNNFFANFNSNGKLTSLPVNSFDTTNISGSAGNYFFYRFNNSGQLASLPGGSFNISNITTAGNYFFDSFNYNGSLTELPIGSFDTTNITIVGTNFLLSIIGGTNFFSSFNENGAIITLPEGSFDMSNISGSVGNCFFTNFNYKGAITSLPESFTMSSVGVSSASGYKNAFNSQSFTLDKNVSQLVLGLRTPSDDRNTFSDNQPGRCGVDPNWLVNAPTNCSTITYMDGETILRLQPSIVDSGSTITLPVAPAKLGQDFVGWYKESTFDTQWDEGVDAVIGNITLYAKYEPTKDIVIQATATEANQTLKINKYFANDYTVDRGDGITGNLTSGITHTYVVAGTYDIILSLSGANRWTFKNLTSPLVPINGTTVTGVQIIYMPSLAEGFGNSATNPGNYFFKYFNYGGALINLPTNSFDTSNITTVGNSFFHCFNYFGKLTTLPENSFNTSNISGAVGDNFFSCFNLYGNLTSLPVGSFNTENITIVGNNFFKYFNNYGQLISLPDLSFRTDNIMTVGNDFFSSFNSNGQLTSLPENSFNTSNISGAVGDNFFYCFNENGQLTSLPELSFDMSNITTVGSNFFDSFNHLGQLTSLPDLSFRMDNITTVGNDFFRSFNSNGQLISLPDLSFRTDNITTVGNGFFSSFNSNGQLISLPDLSFRTDNIMTVGNDFFRYFNSNGQLTSLPGGSFRTDNITTVGNDFFRSFNANGKLTSLPGGSFDTSNITTAGDSFFSAFNFNGQLTTLPDSFTLNSVGALVTGDYDEYFSPFDFDGGYSSAFSSSYILNKKVSDLVSGVAAPLYDRDTFSDNQPGRCGVDPNWLNTTSNACSITYDANGGSEISNPTMKYTADTTGVVVGQNITIPTKTGYRLSGRYTEAEGGEKVETIIFPDMDGETIYAQWTKNQYRIMFMDVDGGNETYIWTGEYGENVTINYPSWTRGGYTISRDKEIPLTVPAEDTIITANWIPNTYTITFNSAVANLRDASGNVPESNTITYNIFDDVALYTNSKSGYIFNGWDVDSQNSGGSWSGVTETITDMHIGSGHFGNVSLNYNSTPDTYTLYIDDTDCTVSPTVFTVIYGKNLNAEGTTLYGQNSLPIPTKTGYNFQGYAKQAGSTDLILRYKNNKVTPAYAFNDGNFVVDHQNKISTIYPVFQAKTITIVYFDDKNGNSNTSSSYGSSVTLPSRQSANYNFLGWYTEQTGGDFVGDGGDTYTILSETTPIKLYARWEAKEYTITFVDGSGEEESVVWTGKYGSSVSVSYPTWTKVGYTISWDKNIPVTVPGDNTIITANWLINEYLITFVDGDGETIQTGMVEYGAMPEYTGEIPTKTATAQYTYTFNNTWSPAITGATEAATYTAQFDSTVNEYLITWNYRNSEGEMVIVTGIVEYGETPVAPVLPGTCQSDSTIYTFIGWDPVIDSVIGDTMYTAQYDSVDRTYTVSFTVNTERYGILNPWSIIAAYGSAITESGNQMIVGGQAVTATASGGDEQYSYEFNRWENECADTVTNTCTITAVFDRLVNQYTVTFVDEDGVTVLGSDTVNYGGTAVYTGETPTKDATAQYTYTFDDWYTDVESGTVDGLDNVISNRNVYARYTSIANRYSIIFVDGSGENENVVWTGDYGTDVSVDYPVWTKAGYTVSWDKEIPDTFPAEDTIITASWTKNPTTNGGYHLKKDNCPGGDYSNSYYDGDCGSAPDESDNQHHSADKIEYDVSVFNPQYSDEMNQAYQYSYYYGITTQAPISEANIDGNLTRVAMAKMLSQYAVNVLGIKPDTSRNNTFNDVSHQLDSDYDDGVTLAYQLGIMGINMPNNEFKPYNYVTRAEFATALSRLLYKTSDGKYENTAKYYVPHISKLAYEGILTNTDPSMQELRGYVMLMLMRSTK